jgi:hypothetical protein
MECRGEGEEQGWAGREREPLGRQRACVLRAGAAPRPARPEVLLLFPRARPRESRPRPFPAPPPGPARPRALDPGLSPLCAGAPRGSRFGGLGLELLAGALETPEPPLRTQACMQGSFNLAFTRSPRTVLWSSGASKKPEAGL